MTRSARSDERLWEARRKITFARLAGGLALEQARNDATPGWNGCTAYPGIPKEMQPVSHRKAADRRMKVKMPAEPADVKQKVR